MRRFLAILLAVLAVTSASALTPGQRILLLGGKNQSFNTFACAYSPSSSGTQGTVYTGATPSASNGVPIYTFFETGTLPPGLTISAGTGIISGTPSGAGTFSGIQVGVIDTTLATANCGASFTLTINAVSGPTVDMNFATATYTGCTVGNCLSVSNSGGTDLLPSSASGYAYNTYSANTARISPTFGFIEEESRKNNLLNSAVPVTQTTASLGTGTYTLWVNGSGSALASGVTATITGAASASNGSANTFTVTVAGTVLVTVTGSLNAFQLEQDTPTVAQHGTSFIVTTVAPVVRSADNIQAAGALLNCTNAAAMTLVVIIPPLTALDGNRLYGFTTNFTPMFELSATSVAGYDGVTIMGATIGGSGSFLVNTIKAGFAIDGSNNDSVIANNGTVFNSIYTQSRTAGWIGSAAGGAGGNNWLNGFVKEIQCWNGSALSNAALGTATQ